MKPAVLVLLLTQTSAIKEEGSKGGVVCVCVSVGWTSRAI